MKGLSAKLIAVGVLFLSGCFSTEDVSFPMPDGARSMFVIVWGPRVDTEVTAFEGEQHVLNIAFGDESVVTSVHSSSSLAELGFTAGRLLPEANGELTMPVPMATYELRFGGAFEPLDALPFDLAALRFADKPGRDCVLAGGCFDLSVDALCRAECVTPTAVVLPEPPDEPIAPEPPRVDCPESWSEIVVDGILVGCSPAAALAACDANGYSAFIDGCRRVTSTCSADRVPDEVDGLPDVVYVDGDSADGGDGTRAAPFSTFSAAVASGSPVIAVADGDYRGEPSFVLNGIRVVGNCDEVLLNTMTTSGTTSLENLQIMEVHVNGGSTTLKNVVVKSTLLGITVINGGDLTLDRVAIQTAAYGVWMSEGSRASGVDVSVRGATNIGLYLAHGSIANLARVVVDAASAIGLGVSVSSSSLDIRELVVVGTHHRGIDVDSGTVSVSQLYLQGMGTERTTGVAAGSGSRLRLHDAVVLDSKWVLACGQSDCEMSDMFLAGVGNSERQPLFITAAATFDLRRISVAGSSVAPFYLVDALPNGVITDISLKDVRFDPGEDAAALYARYGALVSIERVSLEKVDLPHLLVLGGTFEIQDWSSTDVVVGDSAGVAFFAPSTDLMMTRIRVEGAPSGLLVRNSLDVDLSHLSFLGLPGSPAGVGVDSLDVQMLRIARSKLADFGIGIVEVATRDDATLLLEEVQIKGGDRSIVSKHFGRFDLDRVHLVDYSESGWTIQDGTKNGRVQDLALETSKQAARAIYVDAPDVAIERISILGAHKVGVELRDRAHGTTFRDGIIDGAEFGFAAPCSFTYRALLDRVRVIGATSVFDPAGTCEN